MTDKPHYNGRPRNFRHPKLKRNQRYRCMDCGAQFHESTQATKMDRHCLVMGAGSCHGGPYSLHHGFQVAVGSSNSPYAFRTISDAVKSINEWDAD